jgi:hypothetical protein
MLRGRDKVELLLNLGIILLAVYHPYITTVTKQIVATHKRITTGMLAYVLDRRPPPTNEMDVTSETSRGVDN